MILTPDYISESSGGGSGTKYRFWGVIKINWVDHECHLVQCIFKMLPRWLKYMWNTYSLCEFFWDDEELKITSNKSEHRVIWAGKISDVRGFLRKIESLDDLVESYQILRWKLRWTGKFLQGSVSHPRDTSLALWFHKCLIRIVIW